MYRGAAPLAITTVITIRTTSVYLRRRGVVDAEDVASL